MRTTNQVSVYCMFIEKGRKFYILLKRNKKRGSFWQAITGGEEDFDSGNLLKTVVREVKEELGVKINKKQIHKIPYFFKFVDRDNIQRNEQCFGVILSLEQKRKICLSDEHVAIIYSSDLDYLKSLLKFKENSRGLEKFYELIENND